MSKPEWRPSLNGWTVVKIYGEDLYNVWSGDLCVATCGDNKALADRIAAAPDMLEALEWIAKTCGCNNADPRGYPTRCSECHHFDDGCYVLSMSAKYQRATIEIAKAKGEQS
jgi:hypothetical protein